jgi:excisionase family DNA binding protein
MAKDEYLTRKEVMEYLRISPGTLQKLMKQRAFSFIKLERKILIKKSDIDAFLESKRIK